MTGRYDAIRAKARASQLDIFGAFHPEPEDGAPEGCGTLLLLGPLEPGFWLTFTSSAEWQEGHADPVDAWSDRVIGTLARETGAQALFPFTGPPWHPFYSWALRSWRAWASPVSLLVHDTAGLMVSYRGALALDEVIDLPEIARNPCDTCTAKPCQSACPVRALSPQGYEIDACHAYLESEEGASCMAQGCAVRRACPVSQSYGRLPAQSAYHMSRFHR